MRLMAIAGVLVVGLVGSRVARADTHAGVSLGSGVFGVDTISDGHGPSGGGFAVALDGTALADVTGWLRVGGGAGYAHLLDLRDRPWLPGHLFDADALVQGRVDVGGGAATLTAGVSYAYARYEGGSTTLPAHGTMAVVRIGYEGRLRRDRAWQLGLAARGPTSSYSLRTDGEPDSYQANAKHLAVTITLGGGLVFDL